MLILQKESGESFEITWIYDRGDQGFFMKLDNAKGKLVEGNKVTISQYSPKLEKQVRTKVTSVEVNSINNIICVKVSNRRDLPYFKRVLAKFEG